MANDSTPLWARSKSKRGQNTLTASEPEWLVSARDFGLMIAGIYQDLRGDAIGAVQLAGKGIRGTLRKLNGNRNS